MMCLWKVYSPVPFKANEYFLQQESCGMCFSFGLEWEFKSTLSKFQHHIVFFPAQHNASSDMLNTEQKKGPAEPHTPKEFKFKMHIIPMTKLFVENTHEKQLFSFSLLSIKGIQIDRKLDVDNKKTFLMNKYPFYQTQFLFCCSQISNITQPLRKEMGLLYNLQRAFDGFYDGTFLFSCNWIHPLIDISRAQ